MTPDDATDEPAQPGSRAIELEVVVPGTPAEVWRAIATGPGISSWYVPHEVTESEGGSATARFGPDPEMEAPGRVAVWEPPERVVFDGGEGVGGLALEWLVEARDGSSCVVRLVNSGFGSGDEWDDQYDAMTEGWQLFMANLVLHMEHFAGRTATPCIPMARWAGGRDDAWSHLCGSLGIEPAPDIGTHLRVGPPEGPFLEGTVTGVGGHHVQLLVDAPAPGTAFVAAEGVEGALMVSVWSYLYGDDGAAAARRDEPLWRSWLEATGPDPRSLRRHPAASRRTTRSALVPCAQRAVTRAPCCSRAVQGHAAGSDGRTGGGGTPGTKR